MLSRPDRVHEVFLCLAGESGFGKVLPVFTAEGLAATFLAASDLGGSAWNVRRVCGGELISLLYGPCGRVAGVALNPLAESVTGGLRADVERVSFLDLLSGRDRRMRGKSEPLAAPGSGYRALAGA